MDSTLKYGSTADGDPLFGPTPTISTFANQQALNEQRAAVELDNAEAYTCFPTPEACTAHLQNAGYPRGLWQCAQTCYNDQSQMAAWRPVNPIVAQIFQPSGPTPFYYPVLGGRGFGSVYSPGQQSYPATPEKYEGCCWFSWNSLAQVAEGFA